MTDLLADIAATADELTNPMRIVEPIWIHNGHRHQRLRKLWTVNLPSLLDQLGEAVIPGEVYAGEDEPNARTAFASRPAARLDAVDRLLAIEASAARWCLHVALRARDDPTRNVRSLVGAAPTIGSDQQTLLLGDMRAWRTWAATVTGWERPPDAPRAPCLHCGARNTLRIRLNRSTACCLACGAWWDADTIGLLAEHIRSHATRSQNTHLLRATAVRQRRLDDRYGSGRPDRPDLPYFDDTPA